MRMVIATGRESMPIHNKEHAQGGRENQDTTKLAVAVTFFLPIFYFDALVRPHGKWNASKKQTQYGKP